jgi:hypothetical protein
MHADEGHGGPAEDRENGRSGDKIGIGGGDDAVTRIQLAARWSESYAPTQGDSLVAVLKRFRAAYEYLDAVIHGVEPAEPEVPRPDSRPVPAAPAPAATAPEPAPPAEPEPRPW